MNKILGLIVVVGLAYGAYFVYSHQDLTSGDQNLALVSTSTREVPHGYKEYRNEAYRFTFLYPENDKIKEYQESQSAMTLTLEGFADAHGLQVFVVAYAENDDFDERFKKDVPSGVKNNAKVIKIGDGSDAVYFESTDLTLGETKEVWVTHGGFLYEITAPKVSGKWFDDFLTSLRFID